MMTYHTPHKDRRGPPLEVVRTISEHVHEGRTYKILEVRYRDLTYLCLRLYNERGKFIKQFLFEPEVAAWIRGALP